MSTDTITPEQYKKMLNTHDWHYQMSEDPGVYRRGKESRDRLIELSKTCEEFKSMYSQAHYNKLQRKETT